MLLAALGLSGCGETRQVQLDACGNGVLEEGEDCDGSPGCDATCHHPCDTSRDCPAGFGCNVAAHVCQAPRGSFTRQTSLTSANSQPYVADFDADGRDDLLLVNGEAVAFSPSAVHYFAADGQVGSTVELPSAGAAVTAELTGDGRDDVLMGGDALLGFRSIAPRKFSPILSTSRPVAATSRLFSADLTCDRQRDILLLEGRTLSLASSARELVPLLELPYADDELSDLSAVGTLPTTDGVRCEMLALMTSERVDVYGPTGGAASTGIVRLSSVALPEVEARRLQFVDVNGDGRQDLVIHYYAGNSWAAYGVADGSFHSDPDAVPASQGDGRASQVSLGVEGGDILLAAQLDDDPELDFFYGTSPAGGITYVNYDTALALDLTGDGLDDVAALSAGAGRIDLYRSLPSGSSSRLSLTAPGPSSLRDAADVDGDGHADLLVSSSQGPLDSAERSVSVLFTPLTAGATPELQELAELSDIRAMVAGYLADSTGAVDGNADIGILHGKDDARVLGLLQGGPDRLLRSPLGAGNAALETSVGGTTTPVLGRFRQRKLRDLAVIRGGGLGDVTTQLGLLSLGEPGVVSLASAELPLGSTPNQVVVLDLDGDEQDELYCSFFSEKYGEVGLAQQLAQVRLDYTEEPARLELRVDPDFWGSAVQGLARADVDADGLPDLSAQLASSVAVQLAANHSGASGGRFEVYLPFFDCPTPIAHTWVQADTDAELELALNCVTVPDEELELQDSFDVTLRVYDVDVASGTPRLLSERPAPLSAALTTGDFDGDGVQDLAMGSGQAAVLFGDAR